MGVAIFYMFNSLDSQKVMLDMNSSTQSIVELLVNLISWVSVFVAIVLGFLIVYANNFIIKRRKKEFGLYMTLGMGKSQISRILLFETIFIGVLSLIIGMLIGLFGSQLMSILVAKLFQADMSNYRFIFSEAAALKTCLYFGIMYVAVMLFNVIAISKYKLIDLLTAFHKNEEVKIKNPIICVVVFITSVSTLIYAYYKVTAGVHTLGTIDKLVPPICLGVVSTFLIFWSLSGFILKLIQSRKSIYLKGTNIFVLRQVNNKINTTVVSMTVICILLFFTITILSSALSLNNVMTENMEQTTPVDINLFKTANLPDNGEYTNEAIEDSKLPVSDTLENAGIDMNVFKDIVEFDAYVTNELTIKDVLGTAYEEIHAQFPSMRYEILVEIVKISDYNRVAGLYGIPQYELGDNEYMIVCDYDEVKDIWDTSLEKSGRITIDGQEYISRYEACQTGFIEIAPSNLNTGIIVVSDSCNLTEDIKEKHYFIANYNAETEEEKERIEQMFVGTDNDSQWIDMLTETGISLDGMTKISVIESSKGIATVVTFIAIYLGIIFLIASSAVLALKELTENSDNRQRYTILRKIGVDEGMLHKSLFKQISIFFLVPLVLAIIHSIFGIQFALSVISVQIKPEEMIPSIIATVIFLLVVYGGYFIATYVGSKNIIKEER